MFGHNLMSMEIISHDSDTLKPPELDELGQVLVAAEVGLVDEEIDRQVETFPLVVRAVGDEGVQGFLFASLERIGGTPAILWGLGTARRGRQAATLPGAMTNELYRRGGITFPDEDVLVAGCFAHAPAYGLLGGLADRVPRSDHKPSGEERAWGRRLARRFSCDDDYDDRIFRVCRRGRAVPVVDGSMLNGSGGKGAKALFEDVAPRRGEAIIAFAWAMAEDLAAAAAQ